MLRMEQHPEVGGDTAWVSGYGLYDELSPHMQKLLEGLHAVHTSRMQYDTTIVSRRLYRPSALSWAVS
jgi:sulfonate dioxygenase